MKNNFDRPTNEEIEADPLSDIIQNLKELISSRKIKDLIEKELNKMRGKYRIITTVYHKGKEIDRAVNNTPQEPVFNKKDRISFTPLDYVSSYQRASIPNSAKGANDGFTVFYGGVLPENTSGSNIEIERIIAASEACPLIRNPEPENKEALLTFGKWRVKEDLNLLTIVDPAKSYKLDRLNELVNNYNIKLENDSDDIRTSTKQFLAFIADEFSKQVDPKESCKYMISALFSKMVLMDNKKNFDGIIYPSVQTAGEGLCVAILPSSMHKLELIKVLQCKVIKEGIQVRLESIKYCDVSPPNSDFELNDIE